MADHKIHFEVAIEGLVNCFNGFDEARDEYETLKENGYHEATLRRIETVNGDKHTVVWNGKSKCFFPI